MGLVKIQLISLYTEKYSKNFVRRHDSFEFGFFHFKFLFITNTPIVSERRILFFTIHFQDNRRDVVCFRSADHSC